MRKSMTRITAFLMAVLFVILIFPFGAGSGEDEESVLTFYSEWTRPEADLPEVLTAAGSGYTVRLYAPSGERFPKDASAVIRDITEEGDYKSAAAQTPCAIRLVLRMLSEVFTAIPPSAWRSSCRLRRPRTISRTQ